MAAPRRRRGLGMVPILLLGLGLFMAVSLISGGFRGLGFGADSGFLHRPGAPATATRPGAGSVDPGPAPAAPVDAHLARRRAAADAAQRALTAALEGSDPAAVAAAQRALAEAQKALQTALGG